MESGAIRNICKTLVEKSEGKRLVWRIRLGGLESRANQEFIV
jgi:hypothetical protein